jgi:uncharacterized NAD-dependent epimerase/dehydratase family protein
LVRKIKEVKYLKVLYWAPTVPWKRTTTLAIEAMQRLGLSRNDYTGQTGWMQGTVWFVFDSTLNDFISGNEHAVMLSKQNPTSFLLKVNFHNLVVQPGRMIVSADADAVVLQHNPA